MRRLLKLVGALALFASALILPAHAQETVPFSGYEMGTIVIKTHERKLYYVVSSSEAIRYSVGVGRAGMQWAGKAHIEGKYIRPAWCCDSNKRTISGTDVERNPMGAAAMTLRGGTYAIHGTNSPGSIGGFVSHGCIRMYNHDALALYKRVGVGTPVVVLP